VTAYVGRRFLGLVLVWLGVTVLSFLLGAVAPGDPAQILLQKTQGEAPTAEEVAVVRHELGLDRPLPVQYLRWLANAVQGDLGESWSLRRGVAASLSERIPRTVALALAAAALSLLVGVPLGVLAATHHNSAIDHAARVGGLLGASLPSYVLAYILILVLGVKLKLLPVFGSGSLANLVLPAVTLAAGAASTLSRITRASMLEVLEQDYVRTARAKGCRSTTLFFRHALRNTLIPIVTVFVLSLGHLLGGVVIVEWVFAWPGVGRLAIDAIHDRDYPLIQGIVLFSASVYVLLNFLTDVAYGWLDPRIQLRRQRS
jgi:ABC-type dipeptide/oligopeptide/nickel transport system permease component